MANEIQFAYPQSGLSTITAIIYMSGDPSAGLFGFGPVSLADTNSPGVYWGSVPTSPGVSAGLYTVVVKDGATVVGSGELQWDGTAEVKESDLARQSDLTTLATATAVAAIPTNPLLNTDARLDNLDAAISTRLASSGYTAPDNAGITAIKTKTDELNFTAGNVNANIEYVNGIEVKGTGQDADPWNPV